MSDLWVDHVSFSQLTTAQECPYQYFLLKMAGVKPEENAFAQAGTLAHQLLASWAKGEIPAGELPYQWDQRFSKAVTAEFPHYLASKGYAEKLFTSILTYFQHFDGFSGYEIIGAEKEFRSMIAGVPFVGIVDLILRDKSTGEIVIVDHKSCSLSSFKKSKDQMYKQLLLYSKHVADEYGEFPRTLRFNLYKEQLIDERPFSKEDFVAARSWAENVIEEMKAKDLTDWFDTKPEYFRCTNLCNCRSQCAYGKPENHRRKDDNNGKKQVSAVA